MKINFATSLIISLLISFAAYSQNQIQADSIDLFLKAKMEKLHIPGLQLAIVQNGKIIKQSSYGLASIENSVKVTDQSMFAINSCTKAFVGVAVLQLQEEGKLNSSDQNDAGFELNENELNDYGYKLLGKGEQKEALKIFKLNADLYPQSANTNDSYAETQALIGNTAEAVKYYKKVLRLNPKNANAQHQIEKLESK